jgi:hypothetical protein
MHFLAGGGQEAAAQLVYVDGFILGSVVPRGARKDE